MISYCMGGVWEHWGAALEAPTCLVFKQKTYIILMICTEYNSWSHWFSGQSDCLSVCRPGFESLHHWRVFCNFFHALISKKKTKKMAHPYDIIYCDVIFRYHMSCTLEQKLQTYDIIYMISCVISCYDIICDFILCDIIYEII